MTPNQLQHARAERWRQQGNALLTAEDSAAWLREAGLVLFLPRAGQLAAPAPSFVEATLGRSSAMPTIHDIANASGLLRRLAVSGDILALNLTGAPTGEPDFLATPEVLPFIYALRGDRDWKKGPRGKSSPLVLETWKLLDREGALTAIEVKDQLGRQLTEVAALRALSELWNTLRIEPIFEEVKGESIVRWQLLDGNHAEAMVTGAGMNSSVALSALVSLYLQSAVAATQEEIETFLSPVASRAKIRDAVNGLTTTRQLGIRNLGPHEHLFVEGSLPEFPADVIPETTGPVDFVLNLSGEQFDDGQRELRQARKSSGPGEGRKRFVAERSARPGDRSKPFGDRKPFDGARKSFGDRKPFDGARKSFGDRKPFEGARKPFDGERKSRGITWDRSAFTQDGPPARKPFGEREGGDERRPFNREGGERKPFYAREPWKEDRKPRPEGEEGGRPERKSFGDRKPFGSREGFGERKSFGDRKPFNGERKSFGDRKPFDGERKPFGERKSFSSDRKPFNGERKSFGDRKPFDGERKSFGDRKPFGERKSFSSDRKPFNGERKSFGDRKPFDGERKPFGDRKPFGERKSFSSDRKPFSGERKSFGDRKPFDGERKSFGGERRPFTSRNDDGGTRPPRRTFTPREGSGGFQGGERRPFTPREGGDRPFRPRRDEGDRPARRNFEGGDRPARKPFTPSGDRPFRPREDGDRPARKSFGDRKPFDGERKSFSGGAGKPAGSFKKSSSGFGAKRSTSGKPSFGSKPRPKSGPFAKFMGPRKPFGGKGKGPGGRKG